MKKINGLLLADGCVKLVELEDKAEELAKLIECDYFDIAVHKIGGKHFNLVCDDEALLKSNPRLSVVNHKYNPVIFGNVLILNDDKRGNLTSLDGFDYLILLDNLSFCNEIDRGKRLDSP